MGSLDKNSSDHFNSQENLPASSRYIPVSREDSLEIPREELIMVRKKDLERLEYQRKQELERLKAEHRKELERIARQIEADLHPRTDYLRGLAGTLFGIAVGIAGSIPQLLTAPTLSNWVIPTYVVSAIALCVISLILVYIHHNFQETRKDNARNIAEEISDHLGKESNYYVEPPVPAAQVGEPFSPSAHPIP